MRVEAKVGPEGFEPSLPIAREADFKSAASASSATGPAQKRTLIIAIAVVLCQDMNGHLRTLPCQAYDKPRHLCVCATDSNGDGVTNVLDLIDLLLAFGTVCP